MNFYYCITGLITINSVIASLHAGELTGYPQSKIDHRLCARQRGTNWRVNQRHIDSDLYHALSIASTIRDVISIILDYSSRDIVETWQRSTATLQDYESSEFYAYTATRIDDAHVAIGIKRRGSRAMHVTYIYDVSTNMIAQQYIEGAPADSLRNGLLCTLIALRSSTSGTAQ